uniref:Uncharacterized protein n=1 Tax=Tanacetum cinerariifolium TaxID=118510 RepID=A0A699JLQ1_TANCI|nr:hypothetical protein [Tanacetum cinerariifolium]
MTPHHVDWTVLNTMGYAETIKEILEIKVSEMGGKEEVFSSEACRCVFDIKEPIYIELYHEFFSIFEFDEEVTGEELTTEKIIKFRLRGSLCNDGYFDANEYLIRISSEDQGCFSRSATHTIKSPFLRVSQKMIMYGLYQRTTGYDKRKGMGTQEGSQIVCRQSLDATTLRELIGPDGRLIAEDPSLSVLRFAIPRPPRPTLQDLSGMMGRMEIRQGVLEHMSRRQSYHSDQYYSVVLSTWLGVMECPWMETMHPHIMMSSSNSSVEMTQDGVW